MCPKHFRYVHQWESSRLLVAYSSVLFTNMIRLCSAWSEMLKTCIVSFYSAAGLSDSKVMVMMMKFLNVFIY